MSGKFRCLRYIIAATQVFLLIRHLLNPVWDSNSVTEQILFSAVPDGCGRKMLFFKDMELFDSPSWCYVKCLEFALSDPSYHLQQRLTYEQSISFRYCYRYVEILTLLSDISNFTTSCPHSCFSDCFLVFGLLNRILHLLLTQSINRSSAASCTLLRYFPDHFFLFLLLRFYEEQRRETHERLMYWCHFPDIEPNSCPALPSDAMAGKRRSG